MLKTAHLNKLRVEERFSNYELRKAAREKERSGDFPAAIGLYQQCIKRMSKNELGYNRLMIIYRKQKEYKKEIIIVKAAIKVFEDLYKPRRMVNRMITSLSKGIMKATGLADERGNHNFDMGPIRNWKKRLEFLKKQLSR